MPALSKAALIDAVLDGDLFGQFSKAYERERQVKAWKSKVAIQRLIASMD